MKRAQKIPPHFLILVFFLLAQNKSIYAVNQADKKSPDFVFAVFASHRSRADLLEMAEKQNVLAYNVNWESTINLETNSINKVWVRKNHQWVHVEELSFLPHVVYDFGVNKNAAIRKEKTKILKDQLLERGIPFINPENSMFAVNNKLLFANIMKTHGVPHPQTKEFTRKNLKALISKYDTLFIKPTLGSKGQGIIVVEKTPGTMPQTYAIKYKLKYRGQWAPVQMRSITKKNLYEAINQAKEKISRKTTTYIIQQGIKYFCWLSQQTDFRVNVQRNGQNNIVATGFVMRVGGNLAQGGRPADFRVVLKRSGFSQEKIENIAQKVNEISQRTHEAIENYTKSEIGDLGMDVVIDADGNPYIIEANHKNGYPHMYILKNPNVEELFDLPPCLPLCEKIDNDHEETLLDYARFLAKEPQQTP